LIPSSSENTFSQCPRNRQQISDRFLTADEAGRLLNAAGQSRNKQLLPIVALLLLTGARVSELPHAEWRHIDLKRKAWLIPISKTGKSRYVPLSKAAVDIIEALPTFEKCPWLVPNLDTKKSFVSVKHVWQKARKDARLGDVRIHDIRHPAASFMINAGIDLYAVGRVLGHADHKSTMRYSHLGNETLLAAVEAGAAGMRLIPLRTYPGRPSGARGFFISFFLLPIDVESTNAACLTIG